MGSVRVISTSTIRAPPSHDDGDSVQKIDFTPWDLRFLYLETIQKGLLFHHSLHQIQHLKHSLSSTLAFFPPLAGRLVITNHHDNNNNNTASAHITCNNAGVLFVHAAAENTTVADILQPNYVPPIVHSFFPLNGVQNHEGTSQPLFAVQVTELLDGVFIGFTMNHSVADGNSFWQFINSWAEISRGSLKPSKNPVFERWFPNNIDIPIRFPFTEKKQVQSIEILNHPPHSAERIFNFTKEKIAELKRKANKEASTNRVSSLQALLIHLWRSVIRCKRLDPQEELRFRLPIGVRPRMVPPLPEDYFGNALTADCVTVKAGELVVEGGLGKFALEMNKMVSLCSDEMVKGEYKSWVNAPWLIPWGTVTGGNLLTTSSSPRFDVYGNDFGWGKPVAVRSGGANKGNGKITVFAGAEEGSIDIEVCLPHEILEALANEPEFTMNAISN